jgi:hypothetical protein
MKKIVVFLFLLFPVSFGFCQKWITFDDSTNLFRIQIDTTLPNNIWQIGQPQKPTFTSSHSIPNGIVTDLHNTYPINNSSIFYFGTGGDNLSKEHFSYIWFWYKMDCDSLNDFGKVEVTRDMGNTWWNLVNLAWDVFDSAGNYIMGIGDGDTIAFTGKTKGWYHFYGQLPLSNTFVDSIIYRFTFHSDNVPDNRDGWIIDDINFGEILETVFTQDKEFKVYPVPVNDWLNVTSKQIVHAYEISNISGEILEGGTCDLSHFQINVSTLIPGLYFYKFKSISGQESIGKFVKQ